MKAIEAKKIGMEMWDYLRKHPAETKEDLPKEIYDKVKNMEAKCTLCEYNYNCKKCILNKKGELCGNKDSAYSVWKLSKDIEKRFVNANKIYKIIRDWNIYEPDKSEFTPYTLSVDINTEEQESALYSLVSRPSDELYELALRSGFKDMKDFDEYAVDDIASEIYDFLYSKLKRRWRNR